MTIKRVERTSSKGKRWHQYYIDGRLAPGVTTVMKKALPILALPYWAAKVVSEYVADNPDEMFEILRGWPRDEVVNHLKALPWKQRDAAADRGTEVHGYAEDLVHGRPVEVPDELVDYVNSYIKFLDEWRPRPVLVEGVVASRTWHYCGQLDLVADLPDGTRALLDLKTSRDVYPSVAVQLAGYRFAEVYLDDNDVEVPVADLGITETYVVHVRADGYDCRPVDAGEDAWQVFQHLVWLSRRVGDQMKPWLGEPAAPRGIRA